MGDHGGPSGNGTRHVFEVEGGHHQAPPGEDESAPLLAGSETPSASVGIEDLTAPSGRSAGGDILAGLRALTFDPLSSVVRAGGGAVAGVLPQSFKDGFKSGADVMKDGLLTGAGVVKGGLMKTGDLLASALPQEVKDGFRSGAVAAQRGAQFATDAALAGAALAKDVAVEGAGVVASVLPQEFREVANVSREAVEKLAEASRAVERLLKDKAWRNYGGVKKGKKPLFNYYRAHLAYVLGTCTFFGAIMLIRDPNPPDNLVDSIFMAISAMSGAGLTTIPMSEMSPFGMGCIFILMLAGGITFLLLPPVLYRLYQYRQFKPMVQEVIELRKVIRARSGEAVEHSSGALESDLIGDFELQDEALQYVALVIICYDLGFLVLGSLLLYLAIGAYGPLPAAQAAGHPPAWFATFAAVSSFNNVGFSLLDDNYTQLADRPAPLFLMTFMIVAGNTGLPIFLRCIFACLSWVKPHNKAIRFVLDNPRRCTTAFFNTKQTAALFVILVGNLMIQYVFFLATSMTKHNIRALGTQHQLAVGGWFTSVSTRAAGMNVFDLRELSKANVLVFALMMYISSAPLVSLMETTRQEVVAKVVNGELLLVYEGGDGGEEEQKSVYKQYLNSHLRWLVFFYLVIATAEERVLVHMPPVNLFDIMFEILSAYGTSGLSMGAPGKPYSLCGEFNDLSKIVLCVVKLMGKHRGLPKSTDAALDGQFHKIHGMLTQLQDLAKKQKETAEKGDVLADVAPSAAAVLDMRPVQEKILAAASEGLARVSSVDAPAAGDAAAGPTDAEMNGFTLRPE